ncbi:MAG: apolipoprotein N-acyltransferase [Spirochaetes bacterium]|nr:MAG: apolipoprotein N-acyltransferase [Spirochaetota bacterium]
MIQNKIALIIFSSFLYAMALPNEFLHYGSLSIGFIALIPLFYALFNSVSFKETIVLGALFGLLSSIFIYFWLLFFEDFSFWTLSGVAAAHILYFIILSPFIAAAGKSGAYRPFITAGIWIVYEYLKSIGYLGFPWGLMAHTAQIAPFVQIADITGQWGVSFLIVLINTMLLETILIRGKSIIFKWIFTLIILIGSFIYGIYTTNVEIPWEKSITVLMVQQNADSWVSGKEIESIKKGQDLTREALSKNNITPDLVIWSENAFRYPYMENSPRYKKEPKGDPFTLFLKDIDTPILVGSPYILDRSTMEVLNAVLLVSPEGKILEYYGKSHPVPFAENIPFWNMKIVSSFFKNIIGIDNQGWALGKSNIIFEIPINNKKEYVRFGAPICFEDSFPYITRGMIKNGADILINLSNDSWSKTISGETQHLAAARLRTIETRRTLIRSTNAGVSTVIDPWGQMNHTLPLYESATITATIPVYKRNTLTIYTILGDWFPIMMIFIIGFYLFYGIYIEKTNIFK